MQLGFVLLLVAIGTGAAAAIVEVAWPKYALALSALCGLLIVGAAWDFELHPEEIEHTYGRTAANAAPLLLYLIGTFIELVCILELIKVAWRWIRRR